MAIEGVHVRADGVAFAVRLTPKGGRDRVDGWTRDENGRCQLKVRVSAPPEDGRANAALEALLADMLGIAKRAVRLGTGETSRPKRVKMDDDAGALMALLKILGEDP